MAVEGYIGWHGQGKTYCAVDDALERLMGLRALWERDGGQGVRPQLWANLDVRGAIRWHTWDDLMALLEDAAARQLRAVVLVDEAGVVLPARFWAKMDPRVLTFLQQRRKVGAGVDLLWTAPHVDDVDKMVRQVTQVVWACRRIGGSEYSHDGGRPPRLFVAKAFHPLAVGKAKAKAKATRYRPFCAALAGCYSTGLIDMTRPMSEGLESRPDYFGPEDGPVSVQPAPTVVLELPGKGRRSRARGRG